MFGVYIGKHQNVDSDKALTSNSLLFRDLFKSTIQLTRYKLPKNDLHNAVHHVNGRQIALNHIPVGLLTQSQKVFFSTKSYQGKKKDDTLIKAEL